MFFVKATWHISVGLYVLPLCFFSFHWHPRSHLSDVWEMPRQKCTRGLIVDRNCKLHSDISPIPPLSFTGAKKCEIWPRFSIPVSFDTPWFENGRTYRGGLKMQDVKLQDVKMTDQVARHENVGHEIDGPSNKAWNCRTWKCRTWK